MPLHLHQDIRTESILLSHDRAVAAVIYMVMIRTLAHISRAGHVTAKVSKLAMSEVKSQTTVGQPLISQLLCDGQLHP